MAHFCYMPPTSCHLNLLQVKNSDSNLLSVMDDDCNAEFKLDMFFENRGTYIKIDRHKSIILLLARILQPLAISKNLL